MIQEIIEDAEVVSETIKPEAVEPKTALPLTEVQMAVDSFNKVLAQFLKTLDDATGSRKQLVRSWSAAAIAPLNKEDFRFSYPEEKELFEMFNELNSLKLIILMYGLQDAQVLTIHKPLMTAQKTDSEVQLDKIMSEVATPVNNKEGE